MNNAKRICKKCDLQEMYNEKLVTADEAVKIIKSGDLIHYGIFAGVVRELDKALAKRAEELENVKTYILFWPYAEAPEILKADPKGEHFDYRTSHMSAVERKFNRQGICDFMPMQFRELPKMYSDNIGHINVAMIQTGPMDEYGNFNLGPQIAEFWGIFEAADKIIVEINPNQPRVCGIQNSININQVYYVVEGADNKLPEVAPKEASEIEKQIAAHVITQIESGSTLQFGIGSLPNYIGTLIANSDIEDLSVHTEMLVDAYYDLYNAGKITGNKNPDKGKMVYTFALGSKNLYDFLDNNPVACAAPVDYVNSVTTLGSIDKMISINSFLQIDLFGQVNSESIGPSHISGSGGQLDFVLGAFMSKGGKSFLCAPSVKYTKDGKREPSILPVLPAGSIVTVPRSAVQYVATEYGIVNLKGKTIKERVKLLISIAHPDFREELKNEAQKMNIY